MALRIVLFYYDRIGFEILTVVLDLFSGLDSRSSSPAQDARIRRRSTQLLVPLLITLVNLTDVIAAR